MESYILVPLVIITQVLCYQVGKFVAKVRKQEELGLIALAASVYAASETRALKSAPILRQYIERQIPTSPEDEKKWKEQMGKMEGEFASMFGITPETKPPVDNGLDPKDLV